MKASLTGGIASGKSFVANVFSQLGASVVNADRLSREVMADPAVAVAVAARFGPSVLAPDGTVDRKALGSLVFGDEAALRDLNGLTHPGILAALAARMEALGASAPHLLVVAEIPLLFEVCDPSLYRPVVLAWCPAEVQLRRLMDRDALPEEAARARLASQLPLDGKRERADLVVDTSGTPEQTRERAGQAYRELLRLLSPDGFRRP